MTSKFTAGLFAGLKEGPCLFFAPIIGAVKGIREEMRRATSPQHGRYRSTGPRRHSR
jgi:hypothetical protein